MSKLLENKQIVHIAAEIVTIISVVFYFSSKNKKLLEHIENLSIRLDEQDEIIQKHEQIIIQLIAAVNKPLSQTPLKINKKPKNDTILKQKDVKVPNVLSQKLSVSFNDNDEVVENIKVKAVKNTNEESSSEDDSDLDAEIADELSELSQQDGLKKRT